MNRLTSEAPMQLLPSRFCRPRYRVRLSVSFRHTGLGSGVLAGRHSYRCPRPMSGISPGSGGRSTPRSSPIPHWRQSNPTVRGGGDDKDSEQDCDQGGVRYCGRRRAVRHGHRRKRPGRLLCPAIESVTGLTPVPAKRATRPREKKTVPTSAHTRPRNIGHIIGI